MPCYSPLTAYRPVEGGPLQWRETANNREIRINCGQCIGCRLEKSRQWALRCTHEAQLHQQNCFITLTYDDQHLPEHGSLYKPHLTDFWKRLRHHCGPFRYYACGEYGETTQRAHYHACLFGIDFNDKTPLRRIGEHVLYISEKLTNIWGHGNTSIGSLTFETAAYTARYVTKKLSKGQSRFVRLDNETGEIIPLVQPFAVMSLRPAIGSEWLHKYAKDVYGADKDSITVRGIKMKPAKYYDALYDKIDNEHMAVIKSKRANSFEGATDAELRAREKIAHARHSAKKQI